MNKFVLIGFLLLSVSAYSQEIINHKPKFGKSKLMVGVNISSDFCYKHSFNNSNDDDLDEIVKLFNEEQKPKAGYTTGLKILYNYSNKIGLESGIQYSNQGTVYKAESLYFGDQIDPRYGFVYNTQSSVFKNIKKIRFRYNFHYIEIPLRVIYTLGEKKINYLVSVGVTTSYLLKYNEKIKIKYENGDVKTTKQDEIFYDLHKLNFSPTLSIGAGYKLNDIFCVKAEPNIRYGIAKISDSPISGYLWSYGLNVSCYYTLK